MKKPNFKTEYYRRNPDLDVPEFKLFPEYERWFLNKSLPTVSTRQNNTLRRIIWVCLYTISKKKYAGDIDQVLSIIDEMNTRDWFRYCTYYKINGSGNSSLKIYRGDRLLDQLAKFTTDKYM